MATNLTIAGQAADNPPGFTTASKNVSAPAADDRGRRVGPGRLADAGARGAAQRTPNLAPVVQEIVSRTGLGERQRAGPRGDRLRHPHRRDVRGWRGQGAGPAHRVRLGRRRPNAEPVVNAGPDVAVTRPDAATLAGSVTDDGLPNPPGAVTAAWSKVTGPGTVAFADASAASTTATFSAAGSYVLRLTGNDGALQAVDDVTVTVTDGRTGPTNAAPVVSGGRRRRGDPAGGGGPGRFGDRRRAAGPARRCDRDLDEGERPGHRDLRGRHRRVDDRDVQRGRAPTCCG